MRATLSEYRQAPRKVRLVADSIRGKGVKDALAALSHLDKRAAAPLRRLLESAVANAKQTGIAADGLMIREIHVNGGTVLKRSRPRARGRAFPIKKRTSNVTLVLAQGFSPKVKKAARKAKKTETVASAGSGK